MEVRELLVTYDWIRERSEELSGVLAQRAEAVAVEVAEGLIRQNDRQDWVELRSLEAVTVEAAQEIAQQLEKAASSQSEDPCPQDHFFDAVGVFLGEPLVLFDGPQKIVEEIGSFRKPAFG